jgi:hypothetical protein
MNPNTPKKKSRHHASISIQYRPAFVARSTISGAYGGWPVVVIPEAESE